MLFNFKIRFLLAFIIIFIFSSTNSNANLKKNLIEKINKTKTISFSFEQKISDKIETGQCIIKYLKLIKCDYNDKYKNYPPDVDRDPNKNYNFKV